MPDAAVTANVNGRVGSVGLEATGSGVIGTIGAAAIVDRERAIRRLGNPAPVGGDTTVTLHVYSLRVEIGRKLARVGSGWSGSAASFFNPRGGARSWLPEDSLCGFTVAAAVARSRS